MFPTIFQAGPIRLSSYGLMITLAFIFGVLLSSWRAKRRGYPKNFIQDLAVVLLLSSVLGARLLYILTHLEEFAGQWWRTIVPIQNDGTIGIAGLVLLGGVLAGLPVGIWYTRRKGQSVSRTMDVVAPSLALGYRDRTRGLSAQRLLFWQTLRRSLGHSFSSRQLAFLHVSRAGAAPDADLFAFLESADRALSAPLRPRQACVRPAFRALPYPLWSWSIRG